MKWGNALYILTVILILAACGTNSENTNAESNAKEVTADAKGTVKEDGYIKYRSAEWSDDFNGLQTNINSVSVHVETKTVHVWFTVKNTTDDRKFTTYPDQAKLVTDDGMQYDANLLESDNLGGELVKGASKDGDVVFDTNYDNIENLKEIRLIWNVTDDAKYTTKDYDVKLTLK